MPRTSVLHPKSISLSIAIADSGGMSERRRIVLRCADGSTSKAVAAELGVHEHTVGEWRRRFLKDCVEGLSDAPRSGRPRSMEDARAAEIAQRTLEAPPPRRIVGAGRNHFRAVRLPRLARPLSTNEPASKPIAPTVMAASAALNAGQ